MNESYPVLDILPRLRKELIDQRVVILQAPPGAGKSTVLPLHLLEEPWLGNNKIILLEPRRLAARTVALRMAFLRGEQAGETIGYRVRFENRISAATRIEVVTEGILTRLIQRDNTLEGVGLILFDEFHERSLQSDLALAFCLQVQQLVRDDLRIVIMSATLETGILSSVLGNIPVIVSQGKSFPVEFRYYNFDPDARISVRMARALRKALAETKGDILAFLPGAGEINQTLELLQAEMTPAQLHVLYGELPMKKQQEAILPDSEGRRKIVLATSLAETSLTIEGVQVVVDSGYSRIPRFDPRSGLTRLDTVRVTKDSATQRAGRAGRLGPGICYRLWSEGANATLVTSRNPEILDADLAQFILELSLWGARSIHEMTWITPPPVGATAQATALLEVLGAIENSRITERGKQMLQLPTHPRIAHMLLEAGNAIALATDVAALLEEKDPMDRTAGVDLTLRIELLRKWRSGERISAGKSGLERIERLAESWRKILKVQVDNRIPDDIDIGRLVAEAYPERIAHRDQKGGERYTLSNGRKVRLPPHDPLIREEWLSVAHLDAGSGEGKIFLAAPLDETSLLHKADETENVKWDAVRGMLTGNIEKRMGSVVLSSRPLLDIPETIRTRVICEFIQENGLQVIGWGEREQKWQARVMSLRTWRKDPWPDVSDQHLLATIEEWLTPWIKIISRQTELIKLDKIEILLSLLPWELSAKLDQLAPAFMEVPSGSMISLQYEKEGQAPVMEVRLQEVFGWTETPTVNEGRIRIILHLLSPGYKPVQVTQDLKSFWQTAYHEVRKELRIRYRKHSWPEDPWTAKAVRGVVRRK